MPFRTAASSSFVVASLLALGLAACDDAADTSSAGGGDEPSGSSSTSGTGGAGGGAGLPCEVSDILRDKCQSCHSDPPKFGAPMPLIDRDDLLAAPTIEATAAQHAKTFTPDGYQIRYKKRREWVKDKVEGFIRKNRQIGHIALYQCHGQIVPFSYKPILV